MQWERQGEVLQGEITKGISKQSKVMDIILTVAIISQYVCVYLYVHMYHTVYTLNMYNLLYVKYISLKLFYKNSSINLIIEFNFIFLAFQRTPNEFNNAY